LWQGGWFGPSGGKSFSEEEKGFIKTKKKKKSIN
jgi:hypothetical protein